MHALFHCPTLLKVYKGIVLWFIPDQLKHPITKTKPNKIVIHGLKSSKIALPTFCDSTFLSQGKKNESSRYVFNNIKTQVNNISNIFSALLLINNTYTPDDSLLSRKYIRVTVTWIIEINSVLS